MAVVRIPVELKTANLPSPAFNIWHGRYDEANGSPDSIVGALATFYGALASMLAPGVTVNFPESVVEVTTDAEVPIGNVPAPIAASAGGQAVGGLAMVVSWKTSIRARRGRGRSFIGPLNANTVSTAGTINGTQKTQLQNAADALVASSAEINGWALGVWGQEAAHVPGVNVLRDFTSGTVGAKFAHLRSRRD